VLPWAIAFVTAVVAASLGFGIEQWFGIGVVVGLMAGAGCAWFTVREAVRQRDAGHERAFHDLESDADQRVASVIRQFEWSVNDIVRLKTDAERAALTNDMLLQLSREKDDYVRVLERELAETKLRLTATTPALRELPPPRAREAIAPEGAVPFHWALHHDGYGVNLEIQCGSETVRPSQVRIVDGRGTVVMTGGTPMYDDAGRAGFSLARPPVALLVDLEAGAPSAFRLEALVDIMWLPIRMDDTGRRTKTAWDSQGRQYRQEAAIQTNRSISRQPERSINLH
jgi:hypothetical protein